MLLSAVSVLVVAQSSSEIPEGLMNNSVYWNQLQFLQQPVAGQPEFQSKDCHSRMTFRIILIILFKFYADQLNRS